MAIEAVECWPCASVSPATQCLPWYLSVPHNLKELTLISAVMLTLPSRHEMNSQADWGGYRLPVLTRTHTHTHSALHQFAYQEFTVSKSEENPILECSPIEHKASPRLKSYYCQKKLLSSWNPPRCSACGWKSPGRVADSVECYHPIMNEIFVSPRRDKFFFLFFSLFLFFLFLVLACHGSYLNVELIL